MDAAERDVIAKATNYRLRHSGQADITPNIGDDSLSELGTQIDANCHLELLYLYYCRTGRGAALHGSDPGASGMDGVQWIRLVKESPGLLDGRAVTTTVADLVFAKLRDRNTRRLSYMRFLDCLTSLATVKFPGEDGACSAIIEGRRGTGPALCLRRACCLSSGAAPEDYSC